MKAFIHRDATTIEQASAMLAEYKGQAALIAGGTDILGVVKSDILPDYPQALINIKNIPGLDYIKEEAGVLKIGALTRLQDVADSSIVNANYSALAKAYATTASGGLRNMARVGGNLCQKSRCWYYRYPQEVGGRFFCFRKGGALCYAVPGENRYHAILAGQVCFSVCASDAATALSALGAIVVTNKRRIPIGDFFVVLGNTLAQDEIITEVQVPTPKAGTKQTYTKMAMRKAIDWALVSVASAINIAGGTVTDAKITLGGVATVPYRAVGAEAAIKGKAITEELAAAAGNAAVADAFPLSKNGYKVQIAKVMVKRAILA